MLYSMTGYGKAEELLSDGRHLYVEVKSLNGKNFDLNSRFSSLFRSYETQIRKQLQQTLNRGTVDISLSIKQNGVNRPVVVNKDLALSYFRSMNEIAETLSLPISDSQTLQTLMTLPEVIAADTESISESEWERVATCIQVAAENLMRYRKSEGATIEADLLERVGNIETLLQAVLPLEKERIQRIRQRIRTTLEDLGGKTNMDENRFEQELIYYLEKIDFSEEKQRLATHCDYFRQLSNAGDETGVGKKLGFVLQEIGREINTLGSKANDAEIQKIVVNMKDELEKAKEQVLNVL